MCTVNWFILEGVNRYMTVRGTKEDYIFGSFTVAFYSGVISRVFFSTFGYLILYTTLFIGLDRLLALCLPFQGSSFSGLKTFCNFQFELFITIYKCTNNKYIK